MSKSEPELGQAMFGAPISEYDVPEYAESMIRSVISEYARVFWNKNQVQFNEGYGFAEGEGELDIPGFEIRAYYWGDEDGEVSKPNLAYDGVEVRWYKYVGRGMSTNVEWDANKWSDWQFKALTAIRKADDPVSDLVKSDNANTDVANPPSDPKRKANT